MKLNNFIQGTADEELMKSLYKGCIDSGKEPPEELVKAMDKAGLVQVQRTVNGKHGTFTRMQWVKASDVKDSDKVVGKKNDETDSTAKTNSSEIVNSTVQKWKNSIKKYKNEYDEDSYKDAWWEDVWDKTQSMYDKGKITSDELGDIRSQLKRCCENDSDS